MKKLRKIALVLATTAMCLLVTATPTFANPPLFHDLEIVNGGNGMCLGIQGSSGANGARALVGSCLSTTTQTWYGWEEVSVDGLMYVQLRNQVGKCLGVTGSSPDSGAQVVQGTCGNTNDRSQFWRHNSSDPGVPAALRNAHSGLCMGVAGSSSDPGARVIQGHCSSHSTQQWWFYLR